MQQNCSNTILLDILHCISSDVLFTWSLYPFWRLSHSILLICSWHHSLSITASSLKSYSHHYCIFLHPKSACKSVNAFVILFTFSSVAFFWLAASASSCLISSSTSTTCKNVNGMIQALTIHLHRCSRHFIHFCLKRASLEVKRAPEIINTQEKTKAIFFPVQFVFQIHLFSIIIDGHNPHLKLSLSLSLASVQEVWLPCRKSGFCARSLASVARSLASVQEVWLLCKRSGFCARSLASVQEVRVRRVDSWSSYCVVSLSKTLYFWLLQFTQLSTRIDGELLPGNGWHLSRGVIRLRHWIKG